MSGLVKQISAKSGVVGSSTVTGDLTVDTNTLKVDSSNNRVGIGDTSPSEKLVVSDNTASQFASVIKNTHASGAGMKVFGATGTQYSFIVRDYTDTTNSLVVLGNGRVGIGNNAPTNELTIGPTTPGADVGNAIELRGSAGDSSLQRFQIYNNGASGKTEFKLGRSGNSPSTFLTIGPTNTVFNTGNVGIGTTNPTLGILQVEKTSSAGSATIAINAPGSGTHSELYHITANRRFNVGVHGNTGKYFIYDNNAGATRLENDNNGNITTGTTNNERIIIGSAGGGIDFSASSSSYGISGEILKHAESGTWTPTTKIGNTTQSLTGYSVGYDKIGNLVFAHGYVRFTANGTGTITLALPFNPVSAIAISGGYWFDLGTGANNLSGVVYPNSSDQTLLFMRPGSWDRNTTTSYLQHSDFDGNRYIYFSATYRT